MLIPRDHSKSDLATANHNMKTFQQLTARVRDSLPPPYTLRRISGVGLTVFILLMVPITIFSLGNLHITHSNAQDLASIEPESGVITGNISIGTDANASGGKDITFGGPSYPPNTTLTSVSDPTVTQPGYLSSITDPIFSTKIIRIGDQTAMNSTKLDIRHNYAKNQPWNSDESYVYLNYIYPAPLLDGKTYKFIRYVHQPSWSVWSNTNPALTYGTQSPNIFVSHDMNSDSQNQLYTFSQYAYLSLGGGEGNLSDDDHYVTLYAKDSSSTQYVILFDVLNTKPVTTITLPTTSTSSLNWTSVDHDGKYIFIDWDTSGSSRYNGVEQYDSQGNFIRQLTTAGGWHGDFAKDVNGTPVYVEGSDCSTQSTSEVCSISAIVSAYKLDGSGSYPVVAKTINGKRFDNNMHVSGRNTNRPGWIYISDFGPDDSANYINYDEVDAIKLDPTISATNPTVERFAHEYHTYFSDQNVGYPYDPMAVPNHDGSRVMFASDWLLGSSSPSYSYVASQQ